MAWSSEATAIADPYGLGEKLALISWLQDHQLAHADQLTLEQLRDAYRTATAARPSSGATEEDASPAALDYKRLQYRAVVMHAFAIDIDPLATMEEIAAAETRATRAAAAASALPATPAMPVVPAAGEVNAVPLEPAPQRLQAALGLGSAPKPVQGLVSPDPAAANAPLSLVVAEKIRTMPDFWQLDPRGHFAAGGAMYCGPVAVSNALAYLAHHGFPALLPAGAGDQPQIDLINLLASTDYINTNPTKGSGPYNILRGIERYVGEQGYQCTTLAYEGWRKVGAYFKASQPDLDWIKNSIANPHGAVCLNIGWFVRVDATHFRRTGGHFLTVVGFDAVNPMTLLIHNPELYGKGPAALDPSRFELHLTPLDTGVCETEDGGTQPLDGLYQVSGPSVHLAANKIAILEEALVLVIDRR